MSNFSDTVLAESSLVHYFRFADASAPFTDSKGSLSSTAAPNVTPGQASTVAGDTTDKSVAIPNNTGGTNIAYVTFGDPGITSTNPWTIEVVAWHNGYTPAPSIDYGCFVLFSSISSFRILFQSYGQGNPNPKILAQVGGQSVFSTDQYTSGTIVHVILTYDGAGNLDLYVNGVHEGSGAGATPAAINGIWVGILDNLTTYPLNGGVDELALYTSHFDQTTVTTHYNAYITATAPQESYPSSDIAAGGWTPNPSSPTTLFDKLDETSASDIDYISATAS